MTTPRTPTLTAPGELPPIVPPATPRGPRRQLSFLRRVAKGWQLYVMLLLPLAYVAIFLYAPLYGLQIAFKNFSVAKGSSGHRGWG